MALDLVAKCDTEGCTQTCRPVQPLDEWDISLDHYYLTREMPRTQIAIDSGWVTLPGGWMIEETKDGLVRKVACPEHSGVTA